VRQLLRVAKRFGVTRGRMADRCLA